MNSKEYTDDIDLLKYWLVLKRRWLPAFTVLIGSISLAVMYALRQEPAYQASGKLIFETSDATTLTGVEENFGRLKTLNLGKDHLETQAEILRSDSLLEQMILELDIRDEENELVAPGTVLDNLGVRAVPGTDVLSISYEDNDPELAAALVNHLMETYIEYDIQANRADAAAARQFIEEELPISEQAMNEAAEDLRRFKDRNNVVDLPTEARVAVDTLAVLDQQISQSAADLADVRAQSLELSQQLGMELEQAVGLNTLSQTAGVQQVVGKLQAIQTELNQQRAKYTERHPLIENLQRQEAAAYSLLREKVREVLGQQLNVTPSQLQSGELQQELVAQLVQVEVNRIGLQNRLTSLSEARDRYVAWNQKFPDLEKAQQQLINRLQAAQTTYEGLLLRRQQIQLAENQTIGNAKILDYASTPENSVGRSSKLYLGAGAVGGLILGIALAFLLDIVDRSVKTVKEAETLFGYPLLGLIPKYRLLPSHGELDNSQSFAPLTSSRATLYPIISDAYQMLQANLKFVSSDQPLKAFVITSSVADEGKTTVAAQLAMTISQAGRRVLLIDADMRSPGQHHIWNLINGIGLSHVLVGEGSLEEAIQQPIDENLDLMPAGVHPPNPLALLDSTQMANILSQLSDQYDTVIIDTPALAGAADAAILGKMADGVLLVVSPRTVDSARATAAKSLLQRSQAKVLGLVANGVDDTSEHEDYTSYIASKSDAKPDNYPQRLVQKVLAVGKTTSKN